MPYGLLQSFPHHTWQATSPAFSMSASPLRSEDIWGGKEQLIQELINIVKHLV